MNLDLNTLTDEQRTALWKAFQGGHTEPGWLIGLHRDHWTEAVDRLATALAPHIESAALAEVEQLRRIQGLCPMGCGQTLFIGAGGYITCSQLKCPRPDAVSVLLDDQETDHVVRIYPRDFAIVHPLRERLDEELLRCTLHRYLVSLDGPPVKPGRYRAVSAEGAWAWQELDPEAHDAR